MNYPVCGYVNYLVGNTVETYGLLTIAVFLVFLFMLLKDSTIKKRYSILISFLGSVFISCFLLSAGFVMRLPPVDEYQYNEFKHKIKQIKNHETNLTKKQIIELNTWAKCSISDNKINGWEFYYFIDKFDEYTISNQIRSTTEDIQKAVN